VENINLRDGYPAVKFTRSRAAQLAAFFRARPRIWIDGRTLSTVAGAYAWRTRTSDLRRSPFNMPIENRQRHIRVDGHLVTISEYRFVPIDGAADGVCPPSAERIGQIHLPNLAAE